MSWIFVRLGCVVLVTALTVYGDITTTTTTPHACNECSGEQDADSQHEPYIPHIKVSPAVVREGLNVSMTCFAAYETDFTLFPNWSLPEHVHTQNGRVEQHKAFSIEQTERRGVNTLTLYHVTRRDQGDYTCKVIDLLGIQYQETYKLQVVV